MIIALRSLFILSGKMPHESASDQADQSIEAQARGKFENFFWQFEQRIFGYLWHMTGDTEAAHDLSQEAFLRAWQHFDAIDAHRDNGAWLFHVATNLALNHLRRHVARAAIPLNEALGGTSDHGSHVVEQALVRQTLQALSPKLRATLVLHEVYGLSCDEIAQTLKMTHAAVKMALSRAREQFRTIYPQEGEQR